MCRLPLARKRIDTGSSARGARSGPPGCNASSPSVSGSVSAFSRITPWYFPFRQACQMLYPKQALLVAPDGKTA